jgi:hypothetical protein
MSDAAWPALPYEGWKECCSTLHLWTQIPGKIRLAQTPWVNHSWHVPLYVTATGLTTSPIPYENGAFQLDFDFVDHVLWLSMSEGHSRQIVLKPMSVAAFHAAVFADLKALGIEVAIDNMPNEIQDAIVFTEDKVHHAYDRDAAHRFWRILLASHFALSQFRTSFLGKVSPVHFFWGRFDLAVTRFSGRPAPRHPGGVPNLPDAVAREAYSHEVSSAGFWPGGGGVLDEPAFYSYAYSAPAGFADARVRPAAAYFHKSLSEFILPYEAVRTATDPQRILLEFLQSTYEAAANLAKRDRSALEYAPGAPRRPRPV